jgi:TM2 domain-containing membrane protein YozV
MRRIIATGTSFIVPGVGQLFYGKIIWAIGWFVASLYLGFIINVLAAAHALFISSK